MSERVLVQVRELQPGDQILGLMVISVLPKQHYARVHFDGGTSLLMESAGSVAVIRDPETVPLPAGLQETTR